jgi:putative ABC transport system permease protein
LIELLWLRRLVGSQSWKTAGAAVGVALAIALLGSLGAFLTYSFSVMTERAIAGVPVDWQAQLAPGADFASASRAIAVVARPSAMERVSYADAAGFSTDLHGTVQTTGAGVVVGLEPSYRRSFPSVFRTLTGSSAGVLLAQQTAANLHARAGDTVTVLRAGQSAVSVRVDGVVDLPFADSFFQMVGVPTSAAPQAPPDNVLIVPAATWHRWFDSQSLRHPHSVRDQLHVRITHALPHDPVQALTSVLTMARDVELRTAGAVTVGDNLGAQLSSTREDAFYARLLFLFLGLPGAVLATLVALAVIGSGNDRRRREAALLRIRGATASDVRRLVIVEAAVVALLGALGGALLTYAAVSVFLGGLGAGVSTAPFTWAAIACGVATVVVIFAYVSGVESVGGASAERKTFGDVRLPFWRRFYLDWVLLAISALAFWKTAATGYQVVVAPEGVLQATVSYDAFLAPLCLWLGGALLARRVSEAFLARRGSLLDRMLAPAAGTLSSTVAATLSRQRVTVARALTMLGLALSFAISTAVFDATYNAQARVDAELTNGADVTVTVPSATPLLDIVARIRRVRGVAVLNVVQHRFAYVGQDLQDFYGIDALTIGRATHMSDAYFGNHDARASLAALSAHADGVFVSQETVNDFQLNPGDTLNLRLQFASDGKYHSVPFTFVGVVREFPTAPKDSFIIANAGYVAAATGTTGPQTILIRTSRDPSAVAASVQPLIAGVPGARVSDIGAAVRSVGSSLTSVDLRGLSSVELVFAVVLAAGVACLTLALGFAERRRNHAILAALGATPRQLGTFLWSEGLIMLVGGIAFGVALGFGVSVMLVKVLTGVFDPPPDALTIPWVYLGVLAFATVASTIVTVVVSAAAARRDPVRELRRT